MVALYFLEKVETYFSTLEYNCLLLDQQYY